MTDAGEEVAWDGSSTGEIEVRGPWIASAYYDEQDAAKFDRGWLRTGDIAHRSGGLGDDHRPLEGRDQVGRRVDLLGRARESADGAPAVREAAVIATPDERWSERPLACVVLEEGAEVSAAELVEHLRGRVAKWWLPEEFAFVGEVPKTSVGKFDKKLLRAALAEGRLEGRVRVEGGRWWRGSRRALSFEGRSHPATPAATAAWRARRSAPPRTASPARRCAARRACRGRSRRARRCRLRA